MYHKASADVKITTFLGEKVGRGVRLWITNMWTLIINSMLLQCKINVINIQYTSIGIIMQQKVVFAKIILHLPYNNSIGFESEIKSPLRPWINTTISGLSRLQITDFTLNALTHFHSGINHFALSSTYCCFMHLKVAVSLNILLCMILILDSDV